MICYGAMGECCHTLTDAGSGRDRVCGAGRDGDKTELRVGHVRKAGSDAVRREAVHMHILPAWKVRAKDGRHQPEPEVQGGGVRAVPLGAVPDGSGQDAL